MHQASKAQKTPGLPIVANARWSCQFYLIFNFYRLEDPLDDSLRFCYDVPGQMPAISNVGIGSSTSVVKPTEVW
jgi:hypothetical protein